MDHFDGQSTYSVSALCAGIRGLLRTAPPVWVAGEVQRLRRSRNGHLYFELVEKGDGDQIVGKLEGVIWRRDLQRIERALRDADQSFADGVEMRCRGEVDFYPPFGRLQLVVRSVDPAFTLGRLSRRRQQTLEALAKAGIVDRNRTLQMPAVPSRVALVTSEGSAAFHDFVAALSASGLGFRVSFVHTAVQGASAQREIVAALDMVRQLDVDCTVLVRGGGARTDLAAFDSRVVAEAIARSPVPVITGLGHEIDQSVADVVAHSRATTPSQAAEILVQRTRESEGRLEVATRAVVALSRSLLDSSRVALGNLERDLRISGLRLQRDAGRVASCAALLDRAARSRLRMGGERLGRLGVALSLATPRLVQLAGLTLIERRSRLTALAGRRLVDARTVIASLGRLSAQLAPERILERGFSITRDARGRVLRDPSEIRRGALVSTQLAAGRFTSIVEE